MAACCPTCGAPAPPPIQGPRNSVQLKPGARPVSFPVSNSGYQPELTAFRDCDAHTALARGIAEYLGQVSTSMNGRPLQLTTYSAWAEPEENARYPALTVAPGRGEYVRGFTPDGHVTLEGDLRLRAVTEFTQTLTLELWANDPRERAALVAMVEEALNPHDWMYGLRLVLPFYHSTTATYELISNTYMDTAEDAMARFRKVEFTVEASITVYRVVTVPTAKAPRLRLDVSQPGVVVTSDS